MSDALVSLIFTGISLSTQAALGNQRAALLAGELDAFVQGQMAANGDITLDDAKLWKGRAKAAHADYHNKLAELEALLGQ
jgi:hypothetical protein